MEADEAVRRLDEIMDVEPLPQSNRPRQAQATDVELRHLSFTYPEADIPALTDVSLRVPAGKTVALVGPSGEMCIRDSSLS